MYEASGRAILVGMEREPIPMTNDPLTEHRKAILRCVQEIAIAHGVTLSEDQYRAALELIGDVDMRDMKASVSLLKLREKFPYVTPTWNPINDAIAQKKDERITMETQRDKLVAAAACQRIDKEISDEDDEEIKAIFDNFWATHGGRPQAKPQRRLPAEMPERHSPSLAGVPPYPAIAKDSGGDS